MRNLLSTLMAFVAGEGLVWGALGLASVGVGAVWLRALAARAQGTLTRHRQRAACQTLYQQLRTNTSTDVETLLFDLPQSPVGAFLRWRTRHWTAPAAVDAKIASLVVTAEGNSPRLLDVAKVISPLLGLAGTLLGLQHAFSQAHLGKAAVEAGLATALYVTYAGLLIAIAAFCTLRFLVDPVLERLEAELWEAEFALAEAMHGRAQGPTCEEHESPWPWTGVVMDHEPVEGAEGI
jgi:biopolymer transport protein ExbB/TolQ